MKEVWNYMGMKITGDPHADLGILMLHSLSFMLIMVAAFTAIAILTHSVLFIYGVIRKPISDKKAESIVEDCTSIMGVALLPVVLIASIYVINKFELWRIIISMTS